MEKELELDNKNIEDNKKSLIEALLEKISSMFTQSRPNVGHIPPRPAPDALKNSTPVVNEAEVRRKAQEKKDKRELENYVGLLFKSEKIEDLLELKNLGYDFKDNLKDLILLKEKILINGSLEEIEALCSKKCFDSDDKITMCLLHNSNFKNLILSCLEKTDFNNFNIENILENYPHLKEEVLTDLRDYPARFMSSFILSKTIFIEGSLLKSRIKKNLLEEVFIPIKLFSHVFKNDITHATNLLNIWNKAIYKIEGAKSKADNIESMQTLFIESMQTVLKDTIYKNFDIKLADKEIEDISSNLFLSVKDKMKNIVRSYYLENQISEISTQAAKDIIGQFNLREIPLKSSEKIKEIQSLYSKVLKNDKEVNEESLRLLDNLVTKQMPNVITRFLRIDKEYREELKNSEGKYPEQLMLESLVDIEAKINDIVKDINQEHVHALSVANRLTKSIR